MERKGKRPWIPFVTLPPLRYQGQETTYPKGVHKVVVSEPVSARAAEQGSDRASSTHPRLLQPLVPCPQGNRGVEADHRSVLPQCLRALPELHYGDSSVNPRALHQGQWLTSLDLKDDYFHIGIDPADRRYLRFCHNGTTWQFTVLPFGLSTSPRVFTKILKPVLAYAPSPSDKIAHVPRRLVAKPRDTPGSSRAHILAQVPVPKARVGFKPREIGSNPISGCHLSGDRAGHSCTPGKAVTQEIDQLAICSGGIHSTAVTTCCPVAPSTWTPSLSRATSALWSNSHSSHSMAIETGLSRERNPRNRSH